MTILIVLMLSSWDSQYQGQNKIATYETPIQCENARYELNKYYNTKAYLCVKEINKNS